MLQTGKRGILVGHIMNIILFEITSHVLHKWKPVSEIFHYLWIILFDVKGRPRFTLKLQGFMQILGKPTLFTVLAVQVFQVMCH